MAGEIYAVAGLIEMTADKVRLPLREFAGDASLPDAVRAKALAALEAMDAIVQITAEQLQAAADAGESVE